MTDQMPKESTHFRVIQPENPGEASRDKYERETQISRDTALGPRPTLRYHLWTNIPVSTEPYQVSSGAQ